jgi:large conductance mechanosensitive channel
VPVLSYGNFFTVAINFLILAFAIFMMIKQLQRLKSTKVSAQPPAVAPTP